MEPVILASANKDKAAEIREILKGLDLIERPANVPDVDETGTTLEENARLKARALVIATGKGAIADDTGLEVDALDGRPGIYAARYAGEGATYADNVKKLLGELAGTPANERTARFRTVAIYCAPNGDEVVAEGSVAGTIATEARGEGWGYDPLFIPEESGGRTFAEMSADEKHAVSHRGRAFRRLAELLKLPPV